MSIQKSEVVRAGYNKIGKMYHEQRSAFPSHGLLTEFSRQLDEGSRVIDLGCGAGKPVDSFLVGRGYKVVGVDFSNTMLKLARKNVPKAKFVRKDMTRIDFRDNYFDGAVSFYAIIHVPREKHAKIFKSLHRIVKPNGIILVNAGGTKKWEGYAENYLGVKMYWSHYGKAQTVAMIKKAGFRVIWSKVLHLGGENGFWILAKNKKD